MNKYVYVAWFQNNNFSNDDQDFEWPACFLIEANDEASAKQWGDYLSKKYETSNAQKLIKSNIDSDLEIKSTNNLPCIKYGDIDSNNKIGW